MRGEEPVQRGEAEFGGLGPAGSGGDVGQLRGEVLGAQVQQSGEVGAAALDGRVGDVEPFGEGAEAERARALLVEDPQGRRRRSRRVSRGPGRLIFWACDTPYQTASQPPYPKRLHTPRPSGTPRSCDPDYGHIAGHWPICVDRR
ncbi:hypothetical protein GCM10020254_70200 [Streptomyces goshikiensis]